ncbi:hypothetical protein T265_02387 [Opisthorchis viverrini]|uniref:Uncharacterized protein n=1 Tax=Opisthorchis viverrini TaxID=6198 RepID=A0A074ZZA1_OPIVI|nr:hypothetical protein T265_02387 [Opisthorchis viverrini]KER31332.1 hypothetical protein T265_02387 [Opisthorchis viverrini]
MNSQTANIQFKGSDTFGIRAQVAMASSVYQVGVLDELRRQDPANGILFTSSVPNEEPRCQPDGATRGI